MICAIPGGGGKGERVTNGLRAGTAALFLSATEALGAKGRPAPYRKNADADWPLSYGPLC